MRRPMGGFDIGVPTQVLPRSTESLTSEHIDDAIPSGKVYFYYQYCRGLRGSAVVSMHRKRRKRCIP